MLDKNAVRGIALAYANKVGEVYAPKRVVLFGSYVNGNPHEYSDIDIAVIFNDYEGDWLKTWTELIRLTEDISIDIEPHMMDETSDPSGFLAHVMKTGEVIYENGGGLVK